MPIQSPNDPPAQVWLLLPDHPRSRGLFEALRPWELDVRMNADVQAFLRSHDPAQPCAVLLHDELPANTSEALAGRFEQDGQAPTFVLHLSRPDVRRAVRAMRQGAFDCVEVTTPAPEVARVLVEALEEDRRRRIQRQRMAEFGERLEGLTHRQREILDALLEGVTSKTLAAELNLSKKTIDFHRSQILRRLGVQSLVEAAVLVCSQEDGGAARDRLRVARSLR